MPPDLFRHMPIYLTGGEGYDFLNRHEPQIFRTVYFYTFELANPSLIKRSSFSLPIHKIMLRPPPDGQKARYTSFESGIHCPERFAKTKNILCKNKIDF
jgi:hypothetical protein